MAVVVGKDMSCILTTPPFGDKSEGGGGVRAVSVGPTATTTERKMQFWVKKETDTRVGHCLVCPT